MTKKTGKSMLESAIASSRGKGMSSREERTEMALAYSDHKVSLAQCQKALEKAGYSGRGTLRIMAMALLSSVRDGSVKVERVKR